MVSKESAFAAAVAARASGSVEPAVSGSSVSTADTQRTSGTRADNAATTDVPTHVVPTPTAQADRALQEAIFNYLIAFATKRRYADVPYLRPAFHHDLQQVFGDHVVVNPHTWADAILGIDVAASTAISEAARIWLRAVDDDAGETETSQLDIMAFWPEDFVAFGARGVKRVGIEVPVLSPFLLYHLCKINDQAGLEKLYLGRVVFKQFHETGRDNLKAKFGDLSKRCGQPARSIDERLRSPALAPVAILGQQRQQRHGEIDQTQYVQQSQPAQSRDAGQNNADPCSRQIYQNSALLPRQAVEHQTDSGVPRPNVPAWSRSSLNPAASTFMPPPGAPGSASAATNSSPAQGGHSSPFKNPESSGRTQSVDVDPSTEKSRSSRMSNRRSGLVWDEDLWRSS